MKKAFMNPGSFVLNLLGINIDTPIHDIIRPPECEDNRILFRGQKTVSYL